MSRSSSPFPKSASESKDTNSPMPVTGLKMVKIGHGRSPIRIQEGFSLRDGQGDIETLKRSIIANGVRDPIVCHVAGGGQGQGSAAYIVEDGELRWLAVMKAMSEGVSITHMPIILVESGDEPSRVIDNLMRNTRRPYSVLEIALGIKKLRAMKFADAAIQELLGYSDETFAAHVALINVHDEIREAIRSNQISSDQLLHLVTHGLRGNALLKAVNKIVQAFTSVTAGKTLAPVEEIETTDKKALNASMSRILKKSHQNCPSKHSESKLVGFRVGVEFVSGVLNEEQAHQALTGVFPRKGRRRISRELAVA